MVIAFKMQTQRQIEENRPSMKSNRRLNRIAKMDGVVVHEPGSWSSNHYYYEIDADEPTLNTIEAMIHTLNDVWIHQR